MKSVTNPASPVHDAACFEGHCSLSYITVPVVVQEAGGLLRGIQF